VGWPPPGPPYGRCVICGEGLLDPGEACDDGNTSIGDGCNSICQVEANWECTGKSYCVKVFFCGDGIVTSDEICDDHNVSDGDGCSADCQRIEAGWQCPVPGRSCRPIENSAPSVDAGATCGGGELCQPVCGNGIIEASEECDDRILDGSYGGCTAKCGLGPRCGDGAVNGAEECDNGADNGVDLGEYSCTVACTRRHFCGDGIADGNLGEECDLGEPNGQSQQGCDKNCRHVVLPPKCPEE